MWKKKLKWEASLEFRKGWALGVHAGPVWVEWYHWNLNEETGVKKCWNFFLFWYTGLVDQTVSVEAVQWRVCSRVPTFVNQSGMCPSLCHLRRTSTRSHLLLQAETWWVRRHAIYLWQLLSCFTHMSITREHSCYLTDHPFLIINILRVSEICCYVVFRCRYKSIVVLIKSRFLGKSCQILFWLLKRPIFQVQLICIFLLL